MPPPSASPAPPSPPASPPPPPSSPSIHYSNPNFKDMLVDLHVNDELVWDNGTSFPEPCIDQIADIVGKYEALGWLCG
ncbi:NADH dehydrogenase [ubiquinone] 1 beta subcomplex subunit 8, mitochondrial [Tanacetum coccineum]